MSFQISGNCQGDIFVPNGIRNVGLAPLAPLESYVLQVSHNLLIALALLSRTGLATPSHALRAQPPPSPPPFQVQSVRDSRFISVTRNYLMLPRMGSVRIPSTMVRRECTRLCVVACTGNIRLSGVLYCLQTHFHRGWRGTCESGYKTKTFLASKPHAGRYTACR